MRTARPGRRQGGGQLTRDTIPRIPPGLVDLISLIEHARTTGTPHLLVKPALGRVEACSFSMYDIRILDVVSVHGQTVHRITWMRKRKSQRGRFLEAVSRQSKRGATEKTARTKYPSHLVVSLGFLKKNKPNPVCCSTARTGFREHVCLDGGRNRGTSPDPDRPTGLAHSSTNCMLVADDFQVGAGKTEYRLALIVCFVLCVVCGVPFSWYKTEGGGVVSSFGF